MHKCILEYAVEAVAVYYESEVYDAAIAADVFESGSIDRVDSAIDGGEVSIRKNFPESWIWETLDGYDDLHLFILSLSWFVEVVVLSTKTHTLDDWA